MLPPGQATPAGSRRPSLSLPTELVHRTIERQAAADPDAVALRFRDETLSYRELTLRANRLARYLSATGTDPGDRVAVCVEPGFDAVIALLAILKAGATYVPLDPDHPVARARLMVAETRPKLLLARSALAERLALDGVATVALEDVGSRLDGFSGENLDLAVAAEEAACVYYTSGTTGTPKGVVVTYANLAAYVGLAGARYRFGRGDVMPAIARFGFSISLFELLAPLAGGGTVLLLERDRIIDLAGMARVLSEVTFFHAGPGLLKSLLPYIKRHHADFRAFAAVRHASSGGDMVPPDVLEGLMEVFSNAEVFVIYGCSEISCMGCTHAVPRGSPVARTFVGKPFDGVTVLVTDAALRPVPAGVEGEILFAGPGIVRGYLDRAELTAERFVSINGQRFYRTGDMGRVSAEGLLEIVGRADFQVKIRGMRVELGEVEYHLRMAPRVRDGVVVAREVGSGDKVLVAYVVMDDGQDGGDASGVDAPMAAVRRHLTHHLPDFMLPATYVTLERLPLNHNMKVDRSALPEPGDGRPPRDCAPAARAAETGMERRLASLWEKVLRIEHVGPGDHFFDLGGDSLLALGLIIEVDREVGVLLDGMEVLRESLEVQAGICERRLGVVPPGVPPARVAAESPANDAIETLHFGHDRGLYGVLHPAHGACATQGQAAVAALLCSPFGHEDARARFVLQRLAHRLADAGVPALRFDYFGCGDSYGESVAATCARWKDDIVEAFAELAARTGAARITVVGVRLGATLVCGVAERLEIARCVLWDPIGRGSDYYAEMVAAHRRYLGAVQHLQRRRAPRPGTEELLGATYSEAALRELKGMVLGPQSNPRAVPVKWLATGRSRGHEALFRSVAGGHAGSRFDALDHDCGWLDPARLEDVLPDVGIAKRLADMVTEQP
jgi:amino acid adenylation domain-containing protein